MVRNVNFFMRCTVHVKIFHGIHIQDISYRRYVKLILVKLSGMNCNASVHDVPMLSYCSVLGELSYIKGKVHENFMCRMQDRQEKFDGYVSCTFPYLSILQEISLFFKQWWSGDIWVGYT